MSQDTPIDGSRALDEQLQQYEFLCSERGARWLRLIGENHPGTSLKGGFKTIVQFGETFYVTAEISDFLAMSTPNMPTATLREDMLPARAGFVLFEHPLPMPPLGPDPVVETVDSSGAPLIIFDTRETLNDDIAAFGWIVSRDTEPATLAKGLEYGILVGCFARPNGPGTPLRPVLIYAWHFGMTQEDLNTSQAFMESTYNQGVPVEQEDRRDYWHDVRIKRANYFIGLLQFLQQRIALTSRPQSPSRATRKRIAAQAKWTHAPVVRVIEYRRRAVKHATAEPNGDGPKRELHVRFIVGAGTGGFWNHYETKRGCEARWIFPYEKGPPDAPMQAPRATINVVKR